MQNIQILLAHLLGDYILQSSWMASGKVKKWWPAACHAAVYTISVATVLRLSWRAVVVVAVSHLLIDRFRLARYLTFASNFLSPPSAWRKWSECNITGYYKELPSWLTVWLMIIVDNAIHIAILALLV